jgi:hypothetical protein
MRYDMTFNTDLTFFISLFNLLILGERLLSNVIPIQ